MDDQDNNKLAEESAPSQNAIIASPFTSPRVFQAMQDRANDPTLHDEASRKGAANFERILGYPKGLALRSSHHKWNSRKLSKRNKPCFKVLRAPQMDEWESIESESDLFIPQLGEFDVMKAYRRAVGANRTLLRARAMRSHVCELENAYYARSLAKCFPKETPMISSKRDAMLHSLVYIPNTFDFRANAYIDNNTYSIMQYPDCKGVDDTWYVNKYDLQVQGYFGDALDSIQSKWELSAFDMHFAIADILKHQDIDKELTKAEYLKAVQGGYYRILEPVAMVMANSKLHEVFVKDISRWREPNNLRRIHAVQQVLTKLYSDMEINCASIDNSFRHTHISCHPSGLLHRYWNFHKRQMWSFLESNEFQAYHPGLRYLKDVGRLEVIRTAKQYKQVAEHIYTPARWDDYVFRGGFKKTNAYNIFVVFYDDAEPYSEPKPFAMGRISHPCPKFRDRSGNKIIESPLYYNWEITPSCNTKSGTSPSDRHFHEYTKVIVEWAGMDYRREYSKY